MINVKEKITRNKSLDYRARREIYWTLIFNTTHIDILKYIHEFMYHISIINVDKNFSNLWRTSHT